MTIPGEGSQSKDEKRNPFAEWALTACLISTLLAAVFLFFIKPLPPGFAIGLLAVIAMAMTYLDTNLAQRILVISVSSALFALEIRSVEADRVSQDDAVKSVLQANKQGVGVMLENAEKKFKYTECQFLNVISEEEKINGISKENATQIATDIDNITGGNSYPFVRPSSGKPANDVGFELFNMGSYPLTGVTVLLGGPWHTVDSHYEEIGTMSPHSSRVINYRGNPTPHQINGEDLDVWTVQINTQHGVYQESINLKRNENNDNPVRWAYKTQLVRIPDRELMDQTRQSYVRPNSNLKRIAVSPVEDQPNWSDEKLNLWLPQPALPLKHQAGNNQPAGYPQEDCPDLATSAAAVK